MCVPRRLSRRARRRCAGTRAAGTDRAWLDVTDFIAPLVPARAGGRAHRQLHQRRAVGPAGRSGLPWAMVFPQVDTPAAPPVAALPGRRWRGWLLFVLLWWFAAKPRPRGAVSGAFLIGYGVLPLRSRNSSASPTSVSSALLAFGISMGQWLSACR
ncbi:MAG: prolipoprotein diacylglyceryl transferase [Comamonadaceae bacterium]|nr:prolipoprotein diacylglyceryl transferase [Comamonadaceae bacterium]